jgi:hypothetical protein
MDKSSKAMKNDKEGGPRKSRKQKRVETTENPSDDHDTSMVIDERITIDDDHQQSKKRKNKEGRHMTCLLCREDGHLAKNCRLNKDRKIDLSVCFNCGARDHILKDCTQPKSSNLSYAICFICKGEGHIAKDCPDNPNGLYPKGGCCYICQSKLHFSRGCPKREEQNKKRVGFSPGTAKKAAQLVDQPAEPRGDDELDEEPIYEVEEVRDENKEKRKKFTTKNKYYAKPKPKRT